MRCNVIHDSQYTSEYIYNVLYICLCVRTQLPANKRGILSGLAAIIFVNKRTWEKMG